MRRKRRLKRIAAGIVVYWIGEAWHNLDCPYYKRLPKEEREMVKYYIHRYGIFIGRMMRWRYEPH